MLGAACRGEGFAGAAIWGWFVEEAMLPGYLET
jgi:hypothetical protein